jgi:hypothetical protein
MGVARIASFGPTCDTSEGRYQVVELTDKKCALVIGDIRLIRRLPLPIHIGSGVTIHEFASLPELQRVWEGFEHSFETGGDFESANNMCAAWAAWEQSTATITASDE